MWTRVVSCLVVLLLTLPGFVRSEDGEPGKVRVLLLGDSTVIGSVCRAVQPKADHLEDVVRKLLASDPDLPPVEVINRGQDGDTVHRLLASRYEKDVAKQAPFDFIFLRYGLNDVGQLKEFKTEFPANYKKLIARIRADHPKAEIVLETVIPYLGEEKDETINEQVRAVAEAEKLPPPRSARAVRCRAEARTKHVELSSPVLAVDPQKVPRPDPARGDQGRERPDHG